MLALGMLGVPQAGPVSRGACREAVLASLYTTLTISLDQA